MEGKLAQKTQVLRPTAQEELNSSNHHLSGMEADLLPAVPVDIMIGTLWKTLKTQTSESHISDPQKLWNNNIVSGLYILGQLITQP